MNLRFYYSALIGLFALLYFESNCYAQITASQTQGCAPLIGVQFAHPYTGATGVLWNFGNGVSATTNNPTTTFQLPGVYLVTFTANGGIQSSITITVIASPIADFTVASPSSGCIPLNVSFQDNSTPGAGANITNWSWDFGDGGVSTGNNPNPTHLYTLVGINDVTLVVEDNNGCESSISFNNLIATSSPPNLNLVTNPVSTSACNPPLTVDFSAVASSNSPQSGTLTYLWDFGGGVTNTTANPPDQTYTEDGQYAVTLVVTDDVGCSSNDAQSVFIGSPNAAWELIGGPVFCDTVYFANTSDPANTLINWGNGTTNQFNPADTLMHVYGTPGEYTATITTSSPGCSSTDEVTFTIFEIIAEFESSPNFTCQTSLTPTYTSTSTGASEYMWIFGTDTILGVSQTEYTHVSQAEIDPYFESIAVTYGGTLIVTSAAGCTASVTHMNDTIWVPYASFAVDVSQGCAPLTVAFSDSSSAPTEILDWEWHTGDGTVITSLDADEPEEYTYPLPGDYESYLVIHTPEGCTDTSFIVMINVGGPLNTQLNFGPVQVCPGEEVDFSVIIPPGDEGELWSIQTDGGQMSGCSSSSSTSGGMTSYAGMHDVVVYTSYNGCISSTTYTDAIEVLGPIGHFISEHSCEDRFTILFSGNISGADSWTFDFGDGAFFSSTSETSVSHTYASSGDYTAVLTSYASTGCGPFTDTLSILIRDIQASVVDPEPVCEGTTVTLNASDSQDVYAYCHDGYIWIFDEGLDASPIRTDVDEITIEVENGGSFDVQLIVVDENGCTDTTTTVINVFGIDADFEYVTDGECLPLPVDFTDLSSADTTIISWVWNFGSGNMSTDTNPSFTFNGTSTSYDVNLTVADELGCTDDVSFTLTVDIPNPNFSASDLQLCVGDETTFTAQVGSYPYYEWIFGNGESSSDPSYTTAYADSGYYDISLVVQNDAGCFDTLSVVNYVVVQEYPDVGFSTNVDDLENLCYPILIEFTDTTDAWVFDYLNWDLGTGFPVVDNTTVGTIYDAPGTYLVSLEVGTTFGCTGSVERELVIEGPVADFLMSADQICLYDPVSLTMIDTSDVSYYMWDFGNGSDSSMVNPVTYYYDQIPSGGATFIQLITWSADSACSSTTQYPFLVNNTIADFELNNEVFLEDTIHCFGIRDTLTNTSIDATNYYWSLGNGYFTIQENVQYLYPEGGDYVITLIASNNSTGCSDTISKNITIHPEMEVSGTDGLACSGDTIFVAAYGGETYLWSPANYVNDPNSQFPYVTNTQNSELLVLITDINNCSEEVIVQADYIYQPPLTSWSDTTINFGTALDFQYEYEDYHFYDWFNSSGSNCGVCGDATFSPNNSDVFGLAVTDELNCYVDTFYFVVTVLSDMLFYMPNAFTPNGDGLNDLFHPVITRALPEDFNFLIWNRSGQLIWETNDINEKWPGNLNDGNYYSENELYVWKVFVKDLFAHRHEFTGHVVLLR